MPKDPKDYEKYRDYYINRETSEAGKKKRTARDQARTAAIKSGILRGKNDPREVDHKKPLSKGGSNSKSNLQAISQTANRKKYNH